MKPYTEKTIQRALANYFDYRAQKVCMPNIHLFGWEMDFACISQAGVITEVEIKITLADWQNDKHKDKWHHPHQNKVGRFYYAVPHTLAHKFPDWVPEHVGLISVMTDETGKFAAIYGEVRPAKLISKYRASEKDIETMYRGAHFRYWQKSTGHCICNDHPK